MKEYNLRVKTEVFSESHSESIDKELHKRILENPDGTVKLIIQQPEDFELEFKQGTELRVRIDKPQQTL